MERYLTDEQIEQRLTMLEGVIAGANAKDLPALNKAFQRLIDEQVRRDLLVEQTPPDRIHYGDKKRRGEP